MENQEAPDQTPPPSQKKHQLTAAMKADPLSNKLFTWSKIFAALSALCIGFLTYLYWSKNFSSQPTAATEPPPAKVIQYTIPSIQVKLRNEQDLIVEMAIECSSEVACRYIEEHSPQVRDLVIPILTNVDPDIYTKNAEKIALREKLIDRLNTLEMSGKVLAVNFYNFSIEGIERPKQNP